MADLSPYLIGAVLAIQIVKLFVHNPKSKKKLDELDEKLKEVTEILAVLKSDRNNPSGRSRSPASPGT